MSSRARAAAVTLLCLACSRTVETDAGPVTVPYAGVDETVEVRGTENLGQTTVDEGCTTPGFCCAFGMDFKFSCGVHAFCDGKQSVTRRRWRETYRTHYRFTDGRELVSVWYDKDFSEVVSSGSCEQE